MPREVFVDTWAWLALANRRDEKHSIAEGTNRRFLEEGYRFVTSNFVLSESYTLMRLRVHHKAAVEFGKKIRDVERLGMVVVVQVDRDIEGDAWDIFERYEDKEFSFTDCTSFVIMKRRGIDEAFTEDAHFSQAGFRIAPAE